MLAITVNKPALNNTIKVFPEERSQVKAVAMDMWDPFIAATKAFIPQAKEDRF